MWIQCNFLILSTTRVVGYKYNLHGTWNILKGVLSQGSQFYQQIYAYNVDLSCLALYYDDTYNVYQCARMEMSDLSVATMIMKGGLNFATTMNGAQSVTTAGAHPMLMLCVDN